MVFEASPVIGTTHQIFCDELYKGRCVVREDEKNSQYSCRYQNRFPFMPGKPDKNAVELGATKRRNYGGGCCSHRHGW